MDGSIPEEVWPLKEPSPTDLDWLKMSEGKREVWRIADLYRPDSTPQGAIVNLPSDDFMTNPSDREVLALLPSEFLEVCGITDDSNPMNNPYYSVLAIVARLMPVNPTQAHLLKFMHFLGQMSADYRVLLEQKEPRAMLILAWFHAKVSQYHHWWWWKRASLEGRAMCIYLERYHSDIPHISKLLEFPKANCYREYPLSSASSMSPSIKSLAVISIDVISIDVISIGVINIGVHQHRRESRCRMEATTLDLGQVPSEASAAPRSQRCCVRLSQVLLPLRIPK